ncbi:hypothetical protein BDZ91DRAFT_846170 [Kalaharituber pfeilii]|nr:hypothetical protein BDZ91DRAFT_846170 [Kalaharituber pfeilii]
MTTQPAGTSGGAEGEFVPPPSSFAGIVLSIYNDLLANALHEVVHEAHRAEKLLRTQQLQLTAVAEAAKCTSGSEQSSEPKPISNPMTFFPKEIICPKCKLPRHTNETLANNIGGKEEKKKYCSKQPYQNRPLHDIYGNPSPTVSISAKEKKAKAAAAQQAAAQAAAAAAESGNGDSPGDTPPGEATAPALSISNGRKPDAVVYFKCTQCSTEKIAQPRFAAHLEKCLGFAGRKSSRAAMAKISGSGSGAGSPAVGPDSFMGASIGKSSGKATPDVGDADSVRKDKGGSFTVGEEGINVPPPPALLTVTGKVTGTIPKKKKKVAVKDASANSIVPAATEAVKDTTTTIVKEESQPVSNCTSTTNTATVSKDSKDSSAAPKKRKRKSEAPNGDAAIIASPTKGEPTSTAQVADDKDKAIIVARTKPPPKKQKVDGPIDGAALKKNQISKFKDRESPGPTPKKAESKRESGLAGIATTAGKFPPGIGRNAGSPPPSTSSQPKASSPAPGKHLPTASPKPSPKPSPAKLAGSIKPSKKATAPDGTVRKVKPSQGTSTSNGASGGGSSGGTSTGAPNTPKIAKKTLPGGTSTGVNVPAPGKITGKTLPKATAVMREPNKEASPEKMKKTLSNGSIKSGSGTPKLKTAKPAVGTGTPKSMGGKTIPGKTLPGKRAVSASGYGGGDGGGGGGGSSGGGGNGGGEGGVPRKKPKIGE